MIDYTELFYTSDQLANFLMLPNSEQIRILAGMATQISGVHTECKLDLPQDHKGEDK